MPYLFFNKRFVILFLILIIAIPLLAFKYNDLVKFISKKNDTPSSTTNLTLNVPLECPSVKDFCENGKDLITKENYLGFANNLASGSAILASFDGDLTSATTTLSPSQKNEKLITLYLDNPARNLRAVYFFKGEASSSKKVTKGEKIGRSLSKIQAFNASLIFQLIKGDPITGEKLHLTPKDFTN